MATFVVDLTTDEFDGNTSSGDLSLREAIVEANASLGDDVIQLQGGRTYTLSQAGTSEDNGETGDLDISGVSGALTFEVIGGGSATIEASGLGDRVLHVLDGADVTLNDITIQGGSGANDLSGNGGGIAIATGATVTLNRATVSGNTALGDGGGIWAAEGTIVTLRDSRILGNSAEYTGGGLSAESVPTGDGTGLALTRTTVAGNTAGSRGGGIEAQEVSVVESSILNNVALESDSFGSGVGGGISANQLFMSNSTVRGNSAGREGGGISTRGGGGTIAISNSTLANNSARDSGGALHDSFYSVSDISITRSTISGNQARRGAGIAVEADTTVRPNPIPRSSLLVTQSTLFGNSGSFGSAIVNEGTATVRNSTITGNTSERVGTIVVGGAIRTEYQSPLTLSSSIVADNPDSSGGFTDISSSGSLISGGNNLVGATYDRNGVTAIVDGVNGDRVGVDPRLDPLGLQDNGGPTETVALQPNSPALDAGVNPDGFVVDQRGGGFDREIGSPDIGAFELQTRDFDPPVVTAGQTITFVENQAVETQFGQVVATDATGVVGFDIVSGNDAGFFEIDSNGGLSLTPAGVAAAA
ncbi:MAG: choice-of-anchor Q domain-containing protein, partial [Cyanobacteria bacterium J06648_11]